LPTNLVSMYQAKTIHLNTENEMIYANMDGEVKGFKNPTIEIVEKAIRLALPRIS
jgi:diacylglycerol kinase (ATP)